MSIVRGCMSTRQQFPVTCRLVRMCVCVSVCVLLDPCVCVKTVHCFNYQPLFLSFILLAKLLHVILFKLLQIYYSEYIIIIYYYRYIIINILLQIYYYNILL